MFLPVFPSKKGLIVGEAMKAGNRRIQLSERKQRKTGGGVGGGVYECDGIDVVCCSLEGWGH